MKIPDYIKIAWADKVDLIVLLIAVTVAALDLFSAVDLTGGYGFFFVYMLGAVLRIGWWKWQYKNKGKAGFKEIV